MGWTGTDPVKWCRETPQRLTALFRGSVQSLARDLTASRNQGGRMPVKTGNLQRSLLMSTAAMPAIGAAGQEFVGASLNFAEIEAGSKVWLGFQANYAARMNYGFAGQDSLGRTYNQAGFGFIEAAVANWPAIVEAEAGFIFGRVMSRG